MKKILLLGACTTFLITPSYAEKSELALLKEQVALMMKKIEELEAKEKARTPAKETKPAPKVKAKTQTLSKKEAAKASVLSSTEKPSVTPVSYKTIEQRVEALEIKHEEQHKVLKETVDTSVRQGTFDGSYRIAGTNTSIGVNGFIKVDAMHDVNSASTGRGYDVLLASSVPIQGSAGEQRRGNTHFSARLSRFALHTKTPTKKYGQLVSYIEADFFGGSATPTTTEAFNNSYDLRIRQAYVSLGRFLAGQTITTFHDPDCLPESLNTGIAAGIGAKRQPMFRYTHPFLDKERLSLAVAVENPETDYMDQRGSELYTYSLDPAQTSRFNGLDKYPDMTARLSWKEAWGGLSLRGLLRHLRVKNGLNAAATQTGVGVGFSGHIKFLEKDNIIWQIQGGRGIGRYIRDAIGQAAFYDDRFNRLSAQNAYGGYVGLQHWWTENLRSNFISGMTRIQNNPNLSALGGVEVNKTMHTYSVNLVYTVIKDFNVGLEVMRANRKLLDGRKGKLTRLQFSVHYFFGKPHSTHKESSVF